MPDYKRIAERLSEQGLGAVDLAARTAANLPAILSALELAAAPVARMEDWKLLRAARAFVEHVVYDPVTDSYSMPAKTFELVVERTEDAKAFRSAINAALDAAEGKA